MALILTGETTNALKYESEIVIHLKNSELFPFTNSNLKISHHQTQVSKPLVNNFKLFLGKGALDLASEKKQKDNRENQKLTTSGRPSS